MKIKYVLYAIIALAIILGAYLYLISPTGPSLMESSYNLSGTEWSMSGTGEEGTTVETSLLPLGFSLSFGEGDKISGKICNTFGGAYTNSGSSLKAPELVSTLMFCAGVAGEVETEFFNALSGGVTYVVEGGILTMTDPVAGKSFFFTKE